MLGEVDSLTRFQIPQPPGWQHIRDQIKAATIFARSNLVSVHGVGQRWAPAIG